MKKVLSILFVAVVALALVGCVSGDGDSDFEKLYDQETALAAGFTSLANTHANPLAVDGEYTIGSQTFEMSDTYKSYYTSEVTDEKFNYLTANSQWNSRMYTNMVDGLVENDQYGSIVGALAVGYKVETNGSGDQVYTFQLKEGVQWVDNTTGDPYAEVVAADFVTGIEYVLNPVNASQPVNIVGAFIKGAEKYYDALATADTADDLPFSSVGVEAVSKYQVAYTLVEPAPYFLTALTYSPFLPANADYIASVGTAFGVTEDYILVNGAYRITSHVFENSFNFEKNNYYHDYDHVYVDYVELKYLPNAATPSTLREWYEADLIDGFTVSTDDETGWETYVEGAAGTGDVYNPANPQTNGVLVVGDVVYEGAWNFDRDTYEYGTDLSGTQLVPKTEAQKAATKAAILNTNFRLGFTYGMDFIARLQAQPVPYLRVMRAWTNRELTAYNGLDYADYVDAVFNREQGTTGVSLTGALQEGDAVFDIDRAVQYFQTAKTELLAAGLAPSDFPITIDYYASRNVTTQAYEEAQLDPILDRVGPSGSVDQIVDVRFNVAATDALRSEWNWETYNYDLSFGGGWGPDYADPRTYLQTLTIGGDFADNFGLGEGADPAATAVKAQIAEDVFGGFQDLYDIAVAITDATQIGARYEAMAEAEYAAIFEYGLIIPWLTTTTISPVVSKVVPYQAGRAAYGLTSDKFKNIVVSETPMTQVSRAAVLAYYEENR